MNLKKAAITIALFIAAQALIFRVGAVSNIVYGD